MLCLPSCPQVEKEVKKEVDDAVEAAKGGQAPPAHWLWKNVYQEPAGAVMRGILPGQYHATEFDPAYKN